MKIHWYIPALFGYTITLYSCNENSGGAPATDSTAVAAGEKVFINKCSSCHNFRNDDIGPQLGGVAAATGDAWIRRFVKDPQGMISSGDTTAVALYKKFHAVMPSFASLPDSDVNHLIAFLHTRPARKIPDAIKGLKEITNPVPDSIAMSDIKVGLEPVIKMPASSHERPFTRINKMLTQNRQRYVLDLRGKLYVLKNNQPQVYLDMAAQEPRFINTPGLATGFGSFAFHPEFHSNGIFYTTHSEPARSQKADFAINDSIKTALQWVVTEWKTSDINVVPFKGSHRELMRIDMVGPIHGVQEIAFRPGITKADEDYGQLYIAIGDGGSAEAGYPFLPHNTAYPWGAILRIDPTGHNSANGKYGVSSANPFYKDPQKLKEIFAYGFRNPNRISWSRSGMMLVANIGQANIESVNIVHKGDDFGWPLREGPFVLDYLGDMKKIYALPANDSVYHFTYPAILFDHDEGNSISGGFEYTGSAVPRLKGKYIFGDITSGRLFYSDINHLKDGHPSAIYELRVVFDQKPNTLRNLCGDQRVDARFAQDDRGEIYILTKADGMIYKLKVP